MQKENEKFQKIIIELHKKLDAKQVLLLGNELIRGAPGAKHEEGRRI